MTQKILLGEKEYEYEVTFELSYNLLKYRNKIMHGNEISPEDIKVVKEIEQFKSKVEKSLKQNKEINFEESFAKLSPEALNFLQKTTTNTLDIFSAEEIVEIVSLFTNIKEDAKIYEILDSEIAKNRYEGLILKLSNAISEVFMPASNNL